MCFFPFQHSVLSTTITRFFSHSLSPFIALFISSFFLFRLGYVLSFFVIIFCSIEEFFTFALECSISSDSLGSLLAGEWTTALRRLLSRGYNVSYNSCESLAMTRGPQRGDSMPVESHISSLSLKVRGLQVSICITDRFFPITAQKVKNREGAREKDLSENAKEKV